MEQQKNEFHGCICYFKKMIMTIKRVNTKALEKCIQKYCSWRSKSAECTTSDHSSTEQWKSEHVQFLSSSFTGIKPRTLSGKVYNR